MSSQHQLVLEGTVVDLDRVYESRIGIDNGIIKEIGPDVKGEKILHLEEYLNEPVILPSFIDVHVHSRVPGGEHKEDFSTLSSAAIHGGVTTVFDMPNTNPPVTTSDILRQKRERANREAKVDVQLYALVLPSNLTSLASLRDQVIGYKIYMGRSTGGFILPEEYLGEALAQGRVASRIVTVHCEDEDIMEKNTERLKDKDYLEKHADVRSPEAEATAVETLLSHNPNMVNIAHLSTAEALELIKNYRKNGNGAIFCEVAPHHLLLTRDYMQKGGSYGKMNPPLREKRHTTALMEGFISGAITFLATDHAPHTREEKESSDPPSGVPGLDTYGPFITYLIKEGVPLNRIVEATSFLPAMCFGLTNRGRIQVGKRADLVVLDLNSPTTVSSDKLYTKCGWSPFEGMTFPGRVAYTFINGRVYDSQTSKPVFTI